MANELLDFVISLVRDPDVAARYAADPGQALADAHLTGVNSADVNNLLPMVSDSLSMASPLSGASDGGDGNVWTSGAATAAFDAFTPQGAVDHHPAPNVIDASALPATRVGGVESMHDLPPTFAGADTSDQFSTVPMAQHSVDDGGIWDVREHPATDFHAPHDGHDGFDAGHTGFEILD